MAMKAREADTLATSIVAVLKKALAVRDERMAALEARHTALETRVLELEAQRAIAHVEHD
jgi:hypothetical protein